MNLRQRALFAWAGVSTILYDLAVLPLDIIGLFVTPVGIVLSKRRPSQVYPDRVIRVPPRWLWLWGNEQDGYDPADSSIPIGYVLWRRRFFERNPTPFRRFILRYLWAAWRNKTNNFRFLGLFKPTKPIDTEFVGEWTISRSGALTLVYREWPEKRRFTKIGARITADWAHEGVNFAFRWKAGY
jgi:hypothetical protein